MKLPPVIVVQLVHISGPMKGEIQEFDEGTITIGRHPSCGVQFPPDFTGISRNHAEIVREGNEFKLLDHSTNGTYVNGKRTQETFLKDGDVLMFAEGGPKVSFLTQMKEGVATAEAPPPQQKAYREEPRMSAPQEPVMAREEIRRPEAVQPAAVQPRIETPEPVSVQKVNVPLIIQYGPTIRSYKEVPVTIGKHPRCEFALNHPAVYDQHAQIFFNQDQYWIKDLTGQGIVLLNRGQIGLQSPLNVNDEISLSPLGPVFRFLGEGRLAEVIEPTIEKPSEESKKEPAQRGPEEKQPKGIMSSFKKMFKR